MSLLNDTKDLLEDFQNEDLKFLHLIDRVGYYNLINEIKDISLIKDIKERIPQDLEFAIEEDNLNIVSHVAYLENPFIKEIAFKEFFKKTLANDLPPANIDNILKKDIISGDLEINTGIYKNPFSGLMVEIALSESGSFACINRVLDRNLNNTINSVNINLEERIFPYKANTDKDFNLEFIINHELAHITGVQVFNPGHAVVKNLKLVKENHSDVVALIKIIQDNNFTKEESIEIINDLLISRSNIKRMELDLFIEKNYVDEHLTQPSLFLLKDFVNKDFEYIKNMDTEDYTKFAIILAEEACKSKHLKSISKKEKIIPMTEEEILSDLIAIKNADSNNLLTRAILKACKLSDNDELEIQIAKKMFTNPYARFDYELRLLCSINKEDLLKIEFPSADKIINSIKTDFESYKAESLEVKLNLTEFFDYSEVLSKTSHLKFKNV